MEEFYKLLDKHIEGLNQKFQEKFSIKQSLYDDIILVLRDGWGDSQLKFWVNKNFKLVKIGDQNVVYEIKSNLPVVTYENLGLVTPTEACNCNGNCSTKKCYCRAAKVQCGTKCHSSKTKPCANV